MDKLSSSNSFIYSELNSFKPSLLQTASISSHEECLKEPSVLLQTALRASLAVHKTVYPFQIITYLKKILEPCDYKNLATFICKQINEKVAQLNLYKGKSARLKKPTLDLYDSTANSTLKTPMPYDFWIEFAEDGKSVKLLLVKQEPFASGTFKNIYKACSIDISLRLTTQITTNCTLNNSVTLLSDRSSRIRQIGFSLETLQITKSPDRAGKIQSGIIMHRKLCQLLPQSPLASLPVLRLPDAIPPSNPFPYEHKQEFLDCSLYDLIYNKPFSSSDVLGNLAIRVRMVLDIAKLLEDMAKHKIVHCDVKPANIMIRFDGSAVLNDFDWTHDFGFNGLCFRNRYNYWDFLLHLGISLPFCDSFGLIMTLGEVLIPNFKNLLNQDSNVLNAGPPSLMTKISLNNEISKAKEIYKKIFASSQIPSNLCLVIEKTFDLIHEAIVINNYFFNFHEYFPIHNKMRSYWDAKTIEGDTMHQLAVEQKLLDINKDIIDFNLSLPELYKSDFNRTFLSPRVVCEKIEDILKLLEAKPISSRQDEAMQVSLC